MQFDAQLRAIANPTRRAIMQIAWGGERTAGELADAFASVTRPAISQHVRVLVRAGLLQERREQTRRLYHTDRAALRSLGSALKDFWRPRTKTSGRHPRRRPVR